MKIMFIAFADQFHGYGHYFRTQAVTTEAKKQGHDVLLVGNHYADAYLDSIGNQDRLTKTMDDFNPTWLVIDILEALPSYIIELCRAKHIKIAMLNGIGRVVEDDQIHVVWAQDHPDKAILRDKVLQLKTYNYPSNYRFVWGGAADEMGLCNMYMSAMKDHAWIITTKLAMHPIGTPNAGQMIIKANDNADDILTYLSQSKLVVCHLGMLCWESSFLRIPMFMFSRSRGHLEDALRFERLGYGMAYPKVGLPDKDTFRSFLSQNVEFVGEPPDGHGARRFIEALA